MKKICKIINMREHSWIYYSLSKIPCDYNHITAPLCCCFRWHVVLHLHIRQQYKRLGMEICCHWRPTWQVTRLLCMLSYNGLQTKSNWSFNVEHIFFSLAISFKQFLLQVLVGRSCESVIISVMALRLSLENCSKIDINCWEVVCICSFG